MREAQCPDLPDQALELKTILEISLLTSNNMENITYKEVYLYIMALI